MVLLFGLAKLGPNLGIFGLKLINRKQEVCQLWFPVRFSLGCARLTTPSLRFLSAPPPQTQLSSHLTQTRSSLSHPCCVLSRSQSFCLKDSPVEIVSVVLFLASPPLCHPVLVRQSLTRSPRPCSATSLLLPVSLGQRQYTCADGEYGLVTSGVLRSWQTDHPLGPRTVTPSQLLLPRQTAPESRAECIHANPYSLSTLFL